jgi:hypothetical protein
MRRSVVVVVALSGLLGTAGCGGGGGGGGGGDSGPTEVFLHTSGPDTLMGAGTQISHPWIDDNPAARLAVTHVLNPGGGAFTVVNPHPIGVRYVGVWGRWEIFNEDGVLMDPGVSFFVRILEGAAQFLHTALPENTTGNRTTIAHPEIDGDSGAKVFVTQYAGAPDSLGYVENPAEVGVYYTSGTWRIFNQDLADMPLGANFFVSFQPLGRLVFTHDATAPTLGGPGGRRTFMSHPSLDGLPDLAVLVTQNWNPGGTAGVYNDHPIGVFYDAPSGLWAIENVDGGAIPVGASFNVWIQ